MPPFTQLSNVHMIAIVYNEQMFTDEYNITIKGEKVNMNLGVRIKNLRIEKQMTIEQLARATGVTTRTIIYWENGQREMTLGNADKVLKALGATAIIGENRWIESEEHPISLKFPEEIEILSKCVKKNE